MAQVDVKALRNGWFDGTINAYRFQAKVYGTGSKYGIHKGRVSKLSVRDERKCEIISYDRGWDIKPTCDEHWEVLWDLLNRLEKLPASEDS